MKIIFFALIVITIGCKNKSEEITAAKLEAAGDLIGISYAKDRLDTIIPYLERNRSGYDSLRKYKLDSETLPSILFDPIPDQFQFPEATAPYLPVIAEDVELPAHDSLAFYSVSELASLIKHRKISSTELTKFFLTRLEKYDSILHCVITITTESAFKQAALMDTELAAGHYRGPLHGIPYGVKDLMAVEGYPTTWGAEPYKDQVINYNASVIDQLSEAGAVLIAKLTSGALARGDVWFGGKTVTPWDTTQGASGSSAGSGAAVAAGLVPFALGTETLGSITSPSNRNGITGLRPTYGRVSRFGVMSLAWSMDKVGPMCRSAEDCGLVFPYLLKADTRDPAHIEAPYNYEQGDIEEYRIGILDKAIQEDTSEGAENLKAALRIIEDMGGEMVVKELPKDFPFAVFDIILRAESGAFFDELIRSGSVDELVQQHYGSRANSLRQSRFIPAVEYLQANRHRRGLINAMHTVMNDIDVLISPDRAEHQLMITNLTGHPALSIPTGLDSLNHPTSLTLIGNLFEEGKLLRVAQIFQEMTDYEAQVPLGIK